ncbi:MAG: glutaminase [Prevotellaceae bacterium]|jgi:glutaminase|nr:glutaminase [Prevotellaceae bacterium]
MDYNSILQRIQKEVAELFGIGKVADYIPALAKISPRKFGMAVKLTNGEEYSIGDATEAFSIQSISKLIILTLYLKKYGLEIGNRVGVEPSGSAFNSLVQLEYENGIPRNPLINAGAIVLTDGLLSIYPDIKERVLEFARTNSENSSISFDEEIAKSEYDTGFRNFALANFMKSYGNIDNDIFYVLNAYFHHCSIKMSCIDMTRCFYYLANEGVSQNGKQILSTRGTKRINAMMLTCGTYDAVGDFAFRVGVPAKSGVGGGIVGVIPNKMSIAVWSPELNAQGNSVIGMKAMELFTTYTGISIF